MGSLIGSGLRFVWRMLPLVIYIGAGAGIFLGVKSALYADGALVVDRILIQPSDALTPEETQSIETRWLGSNILAVDLKKIAAQLESDPDVQQALVFRHLPSQLKIEIKKRDPIAFIQFASKGVYGLISEDGMILDTAQTSNASLVTIEAYGLNEKEPRRGRMFEHAGFHEAISFLKAFWSHPLARRETITRIALDHLGNVTITLGSQPKVRLGRYPIERFPALSKILPILESPERTQIDYIDLQFDDVIVKRKDKK